MKLRLFLLAALCFAFFQQAYAHNNRVAVKQCIEENSGADSIECLQKIFWKTQQNIAKLEKAILNHLTKQWQADNLTQTHYQMAVSSLRDASKKFAKFSERQCDFAIGESGAVASGSAQVRWSCLIELNDWRIQYLKAISSKK